MGAKTGVTGADVEKLYRKYWPMVLVRCEQILGDAESAADAAQDVFMRVLDKRDTLNLDSPSSLLWTMATKQSLYRRRNRLRRAEAPDGDALLNKIKGQSDLEAETVERDLIDKLLAGLPEKSRLITILYFGDGMTVRDMARALNMSVGGVHERLQALRQTLRQIRRKLESEPTEKKD